MSSSCRVRYPQVDQFRPVLEAAVAAGADGRVVVGGDFNTHQHGLAALVPSLGGGFWSGDWRGTEAARWRADVFAKTPLRDPFDDDAGATTVSLGGLTLWGGKLDWLLYDERRLACVATGAASSKDASDHPWLRIDVAPSDAAADSVPL